MTRFFGFLSCFFLRTSASLRAMERQSASLIVLMNFRDPALIGLQYFISGDFFLHRPL